MNEASKTKLKIVLNVTMPSGHPKVDAAIVGCIEPRLHNLLEKRPLSLIEEFAKKQGWKIYVPLTEAGGIKILALQNPAESIRKEALLQRIEQEIEIHHPPVIALTVHTDCGAYGYSKAFDQDFVKEKEQLCRDLRVAYLAVQERIGNKTPLQMYIIGMNGVVEEVQF